METLKYKVISSENQYKNYCKILEHLVFSSLKTKYIKDEIALLNVLIKKWDEEHTIFNDLDPIQLLKSLMKDHKMKATQLAKLLNVSEGLVSDMLHYKKGLSKDSIRILASHFKLSQEGFNRIYKLTLEDKSRRSKVTV
ncbi:transcriptional regulator [Sphingobacteriaceae bacterium]|nr:transcriptional regulator [Sphingobacteriaceae bacterium]